MLGCLVRSIRSRCPRSGTTRFVPQEVRVSLWFFDWRRTDGDVEEGPIFFTARERIAADGLVLRIWNMWSMENEDQIPAAEQFDDRNFIRRAIADGRIRRLGPIPEVPAESPHRDVLTVPPPWDEYPKAPPPTGNR